MNKLISMLEKLVFLVAGLVIVFFALVSKHTNAAETATDHGMQPEACIQAELAG